MAEKQDELSAEEIARRRALNTPPKPQSEMIGKSARPPRKQHSTVVEKGQKEAVASPARVPAAVGPAQRDC
jgi:hypothetical protein